METELHFIYSLAEDAYNGSLSRQSHPRQDHIEIRYPNENSTTPHHHVVVP